MSKVCLLLLILNVVGMVSCMEQPPKQSRKQQGHQERLVKREVDLIKKNGSSVKWIDISHKLYKKSWYYVSL